MHNAVGRLVDDSSTGCFHRRNCRNEVAGDDGKGERSVADTIVTFPEGRFSAGERSKQLDHAIADEKSGGHGRAEWMQTLFGGRGSEDCRPMMCHHFQVGDEDGHMIEHRSDRSGGFDGRCHLTEFDEQSGPRMVDLDPIAVFPGWRALGQEPAGGSIKIGNIDHESLDATFDGSLGPAARRQCQSCIVDDEHGVVTRGGVSQRLGRSAGDGSEDRSIGVEAVTTNDDLGQPSGSHATISALPGPSSR